MVGMVLLTLASGIVGWNIYRAIQKKQFYSELDSVKSQLIACQKLAVASQTDWQGTFVKKKGEWIFQAKSEEDQRFSTLHLHGISILVDGKAINQWEIDFSCSGKVFPTGKLLFCRNDHQEEWKLSEIFQRDEGQKLGPLHPNLGSK